MLNWNRDGEGGCRPYVPTVTKRQEDDDELEQRKTGLVFIKLTGNLCRRGAAVIGFLQTIGLSGTTGEAAKQDDIPDHKSLNSCSL